MKYLVILFCVLPYSHRNCEPRNDDDSIDFSVPENSDQSSAENKLKSDCNNETQTNSNENKLKNDSNNETQTNSNEVKLKNDSDNETQTNSNENKLKNDHNNETQTNSLETNTVSTLNLGQAASWFEEPGPEVKNKMFTQPIDHSNGSDGQTWEMQVFQYTKFWSPKAPIYMFLGNYSLSQIMDNDTHPGALPYDIVSDTKGVVFTFTLRFHGEDGLTDFKYLNSEQIISDVVALLKDIKGDSNYGESKVVLVGCHYEGSLAVWAKATHPQDIDVVIASGAPLLAKADFAEFFALVKDLYANRAPRNCMAQIENRFKFYTTLFKEKDMAKLRRYAGVCSDMKIDDETNQQVFFYHELLELASNAVYGGQLGMEAMCEIVLELNYTRPSEGPFWDDERKCYDISYNKMIQDIEEDQSGFHKRSWYWLACTEYGWFQTTTLLPPPFYSNIDLDFFTGICSELFGPQYNLQNLEEGVKRLNAEYGGLTPGVKETIFVQGEDDPWRVLGVSNKSQVSDSSVAVITIPLGAHRSEMEDTEYMPRTAEQTAAKEEIRAFLEKLLGMQRS